MDMSIASSGNSLCVNITGRKAKFPGVTAKPGLWTGLMDWTLDWTRGLDAQAFTSKRYRTTAIITDPPLTV